MAVAKNLSLEEQYRARAASGPAEILKERGTEGKRIFRCAFDGTYQPLGPFDVSEPAMLRAVMDALLAQTRAEYLKSDKPFGALLVETAQLTAQGLHTHSGKYANPSSRTRLLRVAQAEHSPYLSSGSAKGMRSITGCFGHATDQTGPGRLFLVNLVMDGRIVTVVELIAQGHPEMAAAFERAGLSTEEYAQVQAAISAEFTVKWPIIDRYLPQLLWPHEGGYVSVVPMPALSVYNALNSLSARLPRDTYLPRTSFSVGSGKAQNISVAASNHAGHLPVLVCEPPPVAQHEGSALLRRLHAEKLVVRVPKALLDQFDVEIHAWPNAARKKFLERMARKHVAQVLSDAMTLRDLVASGEVAVEALPDSAHPLLALIKSLPLTERDRDALASMVVANGPATRFARHTAPDLYFYYTALLQAIAVLEAL